MYGASMRKLKLSDARLDGANADGGADKANDDTDQTPKKGAKGGRKRKNADSDSDGTPVKKRAPHGRKDTGENDGNLAQHESLQGNGGKSTRKVEAASH